jgi:hypothetical protein
MTTKVTNDVLGPGAVTSSHLASGAVTAGSLSAGMINNTHLNTTAITAQSEDTTPASNDYILTYDTSAGMFKKVQLSYIVDTSTLVLKAGSTMTGKLTATTNASDYAIDGKSNTAAYGGVIGRTADGTKYGILGYNNTYAVHGTGDIYSTANVTAYSDIRVKTNIVKIDHALDKVNMISGYTYDRTDCNLRQTGVIAQEILEVLPEAVTQDPETGHYAVAYGNLVGLLIEAIKELNTKIKKLEDYNGFK